jgi:mannitol-1-/sugar-/sorbitol-6-phosphatase
MEAALFDLDGTLVNSEVRNVTIWRLLLENHGFQPDDTLLRSLIGRRDRDVLPDLMPEADVEAIIKEIIAITDRSDLPDIVPVPGAADLVRRVHAYGSPLALVTSARLAWAQARLSEIGIVELVRTIVSAEDVVVGKPDPSGYLAAADRLGVDPAKCVAFEDSVAGVTAARAAGMRCVAVTTTHRADELTHADLVVPDLSAIAWPLEELRVV